MTDNLKPVAEELSARAIVRQRLSDLVEEHPDMPVPELASLFARTLPDQDRQLVEKFLAAEARHILMFELRAKFSRIRANLFAKLDIRNPEAREPTEASEGRARASIYERIQQWQEFVPNTSANGGRGSGRLVLKMNRVELNLSAQYDAQRIAKFGWKMVVKSRLASMLQNDTELVSDRLDAESVANLISTVREQMATGTYRLRVSPTSMPRQITDGDTR